MRKRRKKKRKKSKAPFYTPYHFQHPVADTQQGVFFFCLEMSEP